MFRPAHKPTFLTYTPDGPEFKLTTEGLNAAKELVEQINTSKVTNLDSVIEQFDAKYGNLAFRRYTGMLDAELTIENKAVRLLTFDSNNGYILTRGESSVGRFESGQITTNNLIKQFYSGLTDDMNKTVIQDGDYTITGYDKGPTFVANNKIKAFCMTLENNVKQVIPYDCYVGLYLNNASAEIRNSDGTVEKIKQSPIEIAKYAKLIEKIPELKRGKAYFATKEELKRANEILKTINDVFKKHPEARNEFGAVGYIIRQLELNETDYKVIAKLIQTNDKYDDIKLLSASQIYNKDYSALIEDPNEIARIRREFGNTREIYFGENSMLKTLEVHLSIALAAQNNLMEKTQEVEATDKEDDLEDDLEI